MEPEDRELRRRCNTIAQHKQLDRLSADEEATKWAGPFHFIQAADCQFGMIDRYLKHLEEPGWPEEIQLSEEMVRACNRMKPKPKFLIICGDLADAWPGTETRREQVREFKRIYSKLDPEIALVCVCGNHDIGDAPTIEAIDEYKNDFGGKDYFYFTFGGVLFIVINSQFYENREHVFEYAREQDNWLEAILRKCKLFKYSIVFQHIPWFLASPDEENQYFNINRDLRLHWLDKFEKAGVSKIMCGHYHRNAGGWFKGTMEQVVTSAIGASLGQDKSGARLVKLLDSAIEHQYHEFPDFPVNVNLQ